MVFLHFRVGAMFRKDYMITKMDPIQIDVLGQLKKIHKRYCYYYYYWVYIEEEQNNDEAALDTEEVAVRSTRQQLQF